jgi:hypothetical protein
MLWRHSLWLTFGSAALLQVSVLNGDKKMTSVIDTTPAGIA